MGVLWLLLRGGGGVRFTGPQLGHTAACSQKNIQMLKVLSCEACAINIPHTKLLHMLTRCCLHNFWS